MQRHLAAIMAADVVGYSRLMEADEARTLARLQALRRKVFDPAVARHAGRLIKLMGDGALVEFTSGSAAIHCALAIQRAVAADEEEPPVRLRIAVHIGEVIADGGDIYGDSVNIAARLEGHAAPGGIILSEEAAHSLRGTGAAMPHLTDLGLLQLKNLQEPVRAFALEVESPDGAGSSAPVNQSLGYCRTADGVSLAYAECGSGPPVVKAANYMGHLEYEWQSPVWRHWWRDISRSFRLIRYDERGNGLSDWDVAELTFESFVTDLEAVVDRLALDRFALLGISQGCAVSVSYAVRHPERVTCLVLYGGYAAGWEVRGSPDEIARRRAMVELTRAGWGQDNPAFRQVFTTLFVPGATAEQARWFNELQRQTTSPGNAARLQEVFSRIDVRALLPQLRVPTLVLHCLGDAVVPLAAGREIAAGIEGARFIPLEGNNHLILEQDAAWPRFLEEVRSFVQAHASG